MENTRDIVLFKNKYLNELSRTHPLVPISIAIPVVVVMFYKSLQSELNGIEITLLLLTGALYWSLFEYALHRFIFHYESKNPFIKNTIYIAHGNHHDDPTDKYRSLMPPIPAIFYGVVVWAILRFFLSSETAMPIMIGFIISYQAYDYLHYSFHQVEIDNKLWRKIKAKHLAHHKKHDIYFGVSNHLWDYIFKTGKKR